MVQLFTDNKRLCRTIPFLFALGVLILLPLSTARADFGPKPSMEFEFEYKTESPLEILEGTLFECDKPDCSDAEPLEELGPQGFQCSADSCSSMAYGYSDYHRLLILFSDGKERESNIFQSSSFKITFHVLVREDDLVVEKIRGGSNPLGWTLIGLILGSLLTLILSVVLLILLVIIISRAGEEKADFNTSRWIFIFLWVVMGILLVVASFFSIAIPITVVVEAILALIYAIFRKRSILTTLTMVILANLLTLPVFWMGTYFTNVNYGILITIFAEIIIWLVETAILYLTQRKSVRFWEVLLLAFVLNLSSYLLGLILPIKMPL